MAYPNGMVFDEFRYATGDIDVFRKVGRSWQPWVLVRKSTLPNAGMGLFAARPFATDELIGRYVGKILGHVKSPAVQDMVERMSRSVHGDAIVDVNHHQVDGRQPVQSNEAQRRQFGKVILKQPQWSWPGMYVYIANDARAVERNNATVTIGGYVKAVRNIPAYNFSMSHRQNAASEICWPYGDRYWNENDIIGTEALPYEVLDSNDRNAVAAKKSVGTR